MFKTANFSSSLRLSKFSTSSSGVGCGGGGEEGWGVCKLGWSEVGLSSLETSMELVTNLRCFEDLWSEMVETLERRGLLEKWVLDFVREG